VFRTAAPLSATASDVQLLYSELGIKDLVGLGCGVSCVGRRVAAGGAAAELLCGAAWGARGSAAALLPTSGRLTAILLTLHTPRNRQIDLRSSEEIRDDGHSPAFEGTSFCRYRRDPAIDRVS
jgi:hypothetical protein